MTALRVLTAGILSVWICMAQADVITIAGKVVDKKTAKPVAGARVSLKKTNQQATTGLDGLFILSWSTQTTPMVKPPAKIKTAIHTSNKSDSTTSIAKSADTLIADAPTDDIIQVDCDGYLVYRQNCAASRDTAGMVFPLIANAETLTDIDGNVYQTVMIGDFIWTAENLRTTRFSDSTKIPLVKNNAAWLALEKKKKPGYCYMNNTTDKDSIVRFGALYNWHAVDPSSKKKIAPTGWHVATDEDWKSLENYAAFICCNHRPASDSGLTGNTVPSQMNVKMLAAKIEWIGSTKPGSIGYQTAQNNQTGFNASPTGSRCCDANFYFGGIRGKWWCPNMNSSDKESFRYLDNGDEVFYKAIERGIGVSVRLVKDRTN